MACYKPIAAYRDAGGSIGFKHTKDCYDIQLPCGQCIGCRLEKSRQWAVRILHEAQMHSENSFVTLTYDERHLPAGGTLVRWHFTDFMKRLRSRIAPLRVRYFHCGEYGEEFSRPHYHAIIFGFSFPDRVFHKEVHGERLYKSAFLADVWGHGFCSVGDVSFRSAGYVARYCMKKVNGDAAYDHYWFSDEVTGEVHRVEPEYATMSRRPGIGTSWFEKFGSEVIHSDSVVIGGVEAKPPRFYEQKYDALDLEAVKGLRDAEARKRDSDNTPARLREREVVKEAQVTFLKRGYEHAS